MNVTVPTALAAGGGMVRGLVDAGLCDTCRYQRTVRTTRGSRFSLCLRSREDPAYRRYPPLPVLSCPGHERRPPAETRKDD
jgi:hypothetical protein